MGKYHSGDNHGRIRRAVKEFKNGTGLRADCARSTPGRRQIRYFSLGIEQERADARQSRAACPIFRRFNRLSCRIGRLKVLLDQQYDSAAIPEGRVFHCQETSYFLRTLEKADALASAKGGATKCRFERLSGFRPFPLLPPAPLPPGQQRSVTARHGFAAPPRHSHFRKSAFPDFFSAFSKLRFFFPCFSFLFTGTHLSRRQKTKTPGGALRRRRGLIKTFPVKFYG